MLGIIEMTKDMLNMELFQRKIREKQDDSIRM